MNTRVNKNIFNETGCIRKELLLRYRDHQLSSNEQHEVEEHLVDCALCNEALEGLALTTSTHALDSLKGDIEKLVDTQQPFVMKPWLAAAAITGLLVLSLLSYQQYMNLSEERMAVNDTQLPVKELATENGEKLNALPETSTASVQNQQSKIIPPQDQKATVRQEQTPSGFSAVEKIESAEPVAEELHQVQAAKASKFEVPAVVSNEVAPFSTALKKNPDQNITYVDNVKVIDYNTYDSFNSKEADMPRNTSSQYQNKDEEIAAAAQSAAGESRSHKQNYLDEVADPLILFNNGRYESANSGFDKLLKKNKNDQNAAFYKGLSLFNMKNYSEALRLLDPIGRDSASPFMEEAKFYAAQAHINNGQVRKGKSMLEDISNSNGFYSGKANTELKNIREK